MARYERGRGAKAHFWVVELDGCKLVTREGAVGSPGRARTRTFKTSEAASSAQNRLYGAKFNEGYRAVQTQPQKPLATPKLRVRKGFERARSFSRGTLSAADLQKIVRSTVKGRFGGIDRNAQGEAKDRARAPGYYNPSLEVLFHDGDLKIDGDFITDGKSPIRLLVVDGDLVVRGRFEDSLDPESIVVVTGSLRARDLISEGFLEVHGDVRVERSALFMDNDGCAEIFGNLVAPFAFTRYHAVKVHGAVRARLATGDAAHIQSKKKYTFINETDRRTRPLLSPKLLNLFVNEIFDEDELDPEDPWIDYWPGDKLCEFVRRGGSPLR